jgi:hypothetical protein
VWGVWGSRPLLTFDIPQTALVVTLDTYDFRSGKTELTRGYITERLFSLVRYIFDLFKKRFVQQLKVQSYLQ